MDETRIIVCRPDLQGARKYYRKRDGSWAIAYELQPGVIKFGRLVSVPDRTALDHYEDALWRARAAFRGHLGASDVDSAFAVLEASVDAAPEALRQALKS
jgi:hypothetical protein